MAKYQKNLMDGTLPPIRCTERLEKAARREARRHKVRVTDVIREALEKHLGMKS